MIKRILVPLDGSEFARNATHYACELAADCDAEVVGITVLDLLGMTRQIAPIHAVALKAYHERLLEAKVDAVERTKYALSHFRDICSKTKVSYSEHELQGIPASCISHWASYCDLVVMGLRTFFSNQEQEHSGDSLVTSLHQSVTPILAVPKKRSNPLNTVLVAYDGSHHATRALHAVANLNLVKPFEKAYVVTSLTDEQHSCFLLKQAAAYLRSHQLQDVTMIDTDKDIEAIIHQDYLEKVDLVAAGVHAKRPLKDFFVGSLTKSLVDYGHMPLLLAQ